MAAVKLTKRAVETLPAPPKGYRMTRDTDVKGFGVKVLASGTRVFVYERKIEGKTRRWTLGRFGDLTVAEGRDKAQAMAGKLAKGEDPDADRKRKAAGGQTLRAALAEYTSTRPLKDRTKADMAETMKRNFPAWLDRPVAAITRQAVLDWYRAKAANAPGEANRAARYLRAVLNFARVLWGESAVSANPARVIGDLRAWRKLHPKRSVIQPHELAPWWQAVTEDPDPRARAFFRFVLLTGCRRGEALSLRWTQVDLEAGRVTFLNTKNKIDHELPMGPHLADMMREWREVAGDPWVFSLREGHGRHRAGERIGNVLRFPAERIREASCVRFTVHDLRRTFASVAESLDVSGYALKRLLNHAMREDDVTAGYVVMTPARLRAAMAKIERKILTLAGVEDETVVIPIPKRAGLLEAIQ